VERGVEEGVMERGIMTVREFIPLGWDHDLWEAARQHCLRTGMTTWMVGAGPRELARAEADRKKADRKKVRRG